MISGRRRFFCPATPGAGGGGAGGWSLAEILVACGIAALGVGIALPALAARLRRDRLEGGLRELESALAAARFRALTTGAATGVAMRMGVEGDLTWTTHADGDGDGVSLSDIADGTDRLLGSPVLLADRAPGVRPRILSLAGIPKLPPQGGALTDLDDPIKFGPTDVVSFTPLGGARAGFIYLSEGERMVAVAVSGVTGRLRMFHYMTHERAWKEFR